MHIEQAKEIFANVNGSSFIGLDSLTQVPLFGGKRNPMQGRVTKLMTGANVMVFQNKHSSSYGDMVQRRLEREGKDPATFQLSPRAWGERIPETPFIQHEKDGEMHYYLEVIFLRAGEVQYLLDGEPIAKADIVGLKETEPSEESQGGLENKVVIRSFKLASITGLRVDGHEYLILKEAA